ncbi:hypothetical protein AF335_19105 [Streptomyces eurocidicus]|uniref:DUF1266 domain-containing protein n=1 Tax=Streptomyces eurocidicus TaxID=66423 RepID=A0A2N8NV28_STREU|nr:DUF1266 domain-containing protein [Streptomyces eurocidicus]MBB5122471.1 hypothetical protein [Streptomyces eurocidicus]MBF6052122.1 DUF1266 domain-containing protein [Streptomyces eurocidicus]PNE32635.1 hypothetical protein AF335_19105 [Streptomyces eurocidicus]
MQFAPWTPPTDIERRLHESTARGDWDGQIGALAEADLFIGVARAEADGLVPPAPLAPYRDPVSGRRALPVLTRGALPPWRPDWVFQRTSLAELAQEWPHDKWWLAVNPGLPGGAAVPATPLDREAWLEVCAETPPPTGGRLVTSLAGPLHGPLARGLACGAPLAVAEALPWNVLGAVHHDYDADRAVLRDSWGVTDPAGWRRLTDRLLAGEGAGREAEFALRAREGLTAQDGRVPATEEWRRSLTHVLLHRAASPEETRALDDVAVRIDGFEEWLRREGLLPPGGRACSTTAYDHGCVVHAARLGLAARYCDPAEAERVVVAAGDRSARAYASWQAFSAGFLLGRALRSGEEAPGRAASLAHRALATDPGSPWRGITWS